MVKCPFCQFENEEGALFCEQCKSDLGANEPAAATPPAASAEAAVASEPAVTGAAESTPAGGAEILEASPIPEGEAEAAAEAPAAAAEPATAAAAPSAPAESAPAEAATEASAPAEAAAAEQQQAPAETAPAAPATAAVAPFKLVVIRGLKIGTEFPLYDGENFIGRADEKPVDIDLEDHEPPDRIWSSREHACIILADGKLTIEDLNSSNGTYVNRTRVYPGQKRELNVNDVIQIGTVHLKVMQ